MSIGQDILPDIGHAEVNLPLLVVKLGIGVELIYLGAFIKDCVSSEIRVKGVGACFLRTFGFGRIPGKGRARREIQEPVIA